MAWSDRLPFDYLKQVANLFAQSRGCARSVDETIRDPSSSKPLVPPLGRPGYLSPSQTKALATAHSEISRREDQAAIINWLEQCRPESHQSSGGLTIHDEASTPTNFDDPASGLRRALFEMQRFGAVGLPPFNRPPLVFFLTSERKCPVTLSGTTAVKKQRALAALDQWAVTKSAAGIKDTNHTLANRQHPSKVNEVITAILREFSIFARRIKIYETSLPPCCDNAHAQRKLPPEKSLFDELAYFADRLSRPANKDVFQQWLSDNPSPGQTFDGRTRDAVERVLKVIADWGNF